MMKSISMIDYLKWFSAQMLALNEVSSKNYCYKIVDIKLCETDHIEKFVIQIIGKNAFISVTAQDLVMDESLLRGFSPLDVRTITFYALKNEDNKKPKKSIYKIISQFFSKQKNQEMFTIQAEGSSNIITRTAQEISKNRDLIKQFEAEDAHRIGYVTGSESIVKENEFIK